MRTTTICNRGNSPVIVRISYQGYEKTTLLSPGETLFYPVEIPRANISVDPPVEGTLVVVYDPSDYQELPLMHITVEGKACRRGRFLIPGFRGDGNSRRA